MTSQSGSRNWRAGRSQNGVIPFWRPPLFCSQISSRDTMNTVDMVKWSSGWWFQPIWKILVSWDDYSQYIAKEKMFQTTNQIMLGKNGKRGILVHFMLICPLLWFLCCCSMFLPYLWCFMCCMFWGFFVPHFSGTFCVWMGVGFVKTIGVFCLVCQSRVWKEVKTSSG